MESILLSLDFQLFIISDLIYLLAHNSIQKNIPNSTIVPNKILETSSEMAKLGVLLLLALIASCCEARGKR